MDSSPYNETTGIKLSVNICPLSESLALHVRIPRPIVLYTVYGLSVYRAPGIKLSVKNLSVKWITEGGVSVYGRSVYRDPSVHVFNIFEKVGLI